MLAVMFPRRAAHIALLLVVSGAFTSLSAQLFRPPPPPPNKPAPPSRTAPPPPPSSPAAALAATPITGYEIVAGAEVSVANLALGESSAQCPAGKIPVGGAYDFRGPPDAAYGYVILGVTSRGTNLRYVRVSAHNANVFVAGVVRAFAVCITPPVGTREVDLYSNQEKFRLDTRCNDAERVIGGGATGAEVTQLNSSYPEAPTNAAEWREGTGWRLEAQRKGILVNHSVVGTLLCAPAASVDGWEHVRSAPVRLGARGRAQLELRCPSGKSMLTAGIAGGPGLGLVVSSLLIRVDGTATAQVLNRSILHDDISPSLVGVCARRV